MLKLHKKAILLVTTSLIGLLISGCHQKQDEKITPSDPETDFINNYQGLSPEEILGKKIFFDKSLSKPEGQSCASCHASLNAFSDPSHLAFSEGAVKGLFGTRNTPAISYMTYAPPRFYDSEDSTYIGGFFWDGRVNRLEQQAALPLMNHVEMNNTSKKDIIDKIKFGSYASLFLNIYGTNAFDDTTSALDLALQAVATYEKSRQINPFSSKFDYYIKGEVALTDKELKGLELFNSKAKCNNCHPSTPVTGFTEILFTDYSYDNIGLPPHPNQNKTDLGLGGILNDVNEYGKFKVSTLRNIAITAPYFHNGYITDLKEVIRFYNERDKQGAFPPAEVSSTMNTDELGDLQLTEEEIEHLIAFLETLTDGYKK